MFAKLLRIRWERTSSRRLRLGRNRRRKGIAAIETAVMIPLLVFLTFGSIELANLIFLRQSVAIASYEGARSSTRPGGSQTSGTERIRQVLTARGVATFSVEYTPAITTSTARGTMITVTVRANTSNLTYSPFQLFTGTNVSSSTTMVRQ